MSDVKLELKEVVSRDDAAAWLSTLSRAFGSDGHVELPIGPGIVSVHVPDRVRAEIEVEVEGDEVEVEVEFKWSTAKPLTDSSAGQAPPASAQRPTRRGQQKSG
jgi:amphi-Trp domain-containing protein